MVGTASDPFMARDRIKELNPDVLTLDVEMPRMDGLTFLANLMRLRPMPVVMVSSLTERGAETTLKALELGAVDFVSKPKIDLAGTLADFGDEILAKIRIAAGARVMARSAPVAASRVAPKYSADAVILPADARRQDAAHHGSHHRHRCIDGWYRSDPRSPHGAAGGLPGHRDRAAHSRGLQPAVHAAHGFAGRDVGRASRPTASTSWPGHVYIAPGGKHLLVERDGARYRCRLNNGPPVNRHCPSVDVLFRSVAQNVGPNAVGVILTGMGDDGARGLKEMLRRRCAAPWRRTKRTSVVWGMPGAAVKLGGAQEILPLGRVAETHHAIGADRGRAGVCGGPLEGEKKWHRMIMTVDDSTSMRQMVKATLHVGGIRRRRSTPTARKRSSTRATIPWTW